MKRTKQEILEKIAWLKKHRPDGWRGVIRQLIHDLENLDDPYGEHEYHGDENTGRRGRCPPSKPF